MALKLDTSPLIAPVSEISVHAIRTGSVRVRPNQVAGKGSGARRLFNTLIDRGWSEWLPIYAWVIEHPEGTIVVDTGETSRTADRGYFPAWHPYYRQGVGFDVKSGEEIGDQLDDRWIDPSSVPKVIMTHLHTDHAGGLHHFPDSEILVERSANAEASGIAGRMRGFLPNRWPEWFKPTLFELEDTPFGPFPKSLNVTSSADVVLVPTPGHTPNHVSVVVRAKDRTYFLAGDASYTQQLMLDEKVDGIGMNEAVSRQTLRRIRAFAEGEPVIYLPSHDPESEQRLSRGETVFAGR